MNDRLVHVIDKILASSTTRPIIVLQGDHGSWSSRFEKGVAPQGVAAERMSILNAYLVPDGVAALISPEITPVNTFRAIDGGLFGEAVDQLPNERWYGPGGPPSNLTLYVPNDRAKVSDPAATSNGCPAGPQSCSSRRPWRR